VEGGVVENTAQLVGGQIFLVLLHLVCLILHNTPVSEVLCHESLISFATGPISCPGLCPATQEAHLAPIPVEGEGTHSEVLEPVHDCGQRSPHKFRLGHRWLINFLIKGSNGGVGQAAILLGSRPSGCFRRDQGRKPVPLLLWGCPWSWVICLSSLRVNDGERVYYDFVLT